MNFLKKILGIARKDVAGANNPVTEKERVTVDREMVEKETVEYTSYSLSDKREEKLADVQKQQDNQEGNLLEEKLEEELLHQIEFMKENDNPGGDIAREETVQSVNLVSEMKEYIASSEKSEDTGAKDEVQTEKSGISPKREAAKRKLREKLSFYDLTFADMEDLFETEEMGEISILTNSETLEENRVKKKTSGNTGSFEENFDIEEITSEELADTVLNEKVLYNSSYSRKPSTHWMRIERDPELDETSDNDSAVSCFAMQKKVTEGIESGKVEKAEKKEEQIPEKKYVMPSVALLNSPWYSRQQNQTTMISELLEKKTKIQETLDLFGVDAKVVDYNCGPLVTCFEIKPAVGVRVSRIVGLSDDIKMALACTNIRIEAPIPGKSVIGIEVPNNKRSIVSLGEILSSEEFQRAESKLSFAMGKDITGKVVVADIAKMPHLLIAGETGSGKSVCIHTIIMSILYKAKPDEVKLILIDIKMVELSVYNGIPHLLIPVVTDSRKASGALQWAVTEMNRRYNLFAETGVRDINGFNAKLEQTLVPETEKKKNYMYKIVIIIDELADPMMVASKDIEESICRLAQMARACGIHLIIATQKSTVNVITGLIKANMNSRIAFTVSSAIDSRTILDMNGAEKLLGNGDMLVRPQGALKPKRIQGSFVSYEEISRVVEFIRESYGASLDTCEVTKKTDSLNGNFSQPAVEHDDPEKETDVYFVEAGRIICDKEKASIGMLQRYLKVGFNRAARIMDELEAAGVVGPEVGIQPRVVLMSQEQFENYIVQKNIDSTCADIVLRKKDELCRPYTKQGENTEAGNKTCSKSDNLLQNQKLANESEGIDDPYFAEAGRIVCDKEKASIGILQRYLKVRFNRALRIMDELEEAGVVGPEEGTKPRTVLMTSEQFENYLMHNM